MRGKEEREERKDGHTRISVDSELSTSSFLESGSGWVGFGIGDRESWGNSCQDGSDDAGGVDELHGESVGG